MRSTPHSESRSSMKSETVLAMVGDLLSAPRVGDCRKQCVLGLTRVEPGVLDDDRRVGANHARVVGIARYRLRIGELVEAQVPGSPRRHRHPVRARRLAILEVDRDLDLGLAVPGVEETGGLVALHLGLRPVASAGDVSLGDRPHGPARSGFGSVLRHGPPIPARVSPQTTRWPDPAVTGMTPAPRIRGASRRVPESAKAIPSMEVDG